MQKISSYKYSAQSKPFGIDSRSKSPINFKGIVCPTEYSALLQKAVGKVTSSTSLRGRLSGVQIVTEQILHGMTRKPLQILEALEVKDSSVSGVIEKKIFKVFKRDFLDSLGVKKMSDEQLRDSYGVMKTHYNSKSIGFDVFLDSLLKSFAIK